MALRPFLLMLLAALLLPCASARAEDPAPAAELVGPVQGFTLESRILGQERELLVALPRDYASTDERYPVLYVLDSEWHLLPAVAAMRMLAETSYIQAHRIPPMIVVGIRGIDRNHDHTPTSCVQQHGMSFPTSGGAEAFLDFFADELIPEIDRRYRTQPYRILAGWSLGGLLTLHAVLDRPEVFQAHLAISPSLWWDDRLLLKRAQGLVEQATSRDRDLVITIGTGEKGGLCYEAVHELVRRWEEAPVTGLRWQFLEIDGEDHNHGPYKAYFEGLRALFADWFFPEAVFEQGLEALEDHYAALSERRGTPLPVPEHIYNALAMTYLSEGRGEEAIAVAERQCAGDPGSALLRYQLGETCRKAGRPELAREAYERALELEQHSSAPDSVFLRWLGGRLDDLETE